MNKTWISKIEINDGSTINIGENDIVVFVGPNNAGKSVSLREISQSLKINKPQTIIKKIEIEAEGTESELISWLQGFSKKTFHDNRKDPRYTGFGYSFYENDLKEAWSEHKDGLKSLSEVFVKLLSTEIRLTLSNPAPSIPLTTEIESHPIHFLQYNDGVEKEFSDYFRTVFGTDLIVHRMAGNIVPLYVGERPQIESGEDRLSRSYVDKVDKLSPLQFQGDGMRSFVGVLLNAFIGHSIQLIDEPEAFLHPPQARLLGKMLAKKLAPDNQLFLATHSEAFLKGLLDSNSKNLKIIRLQREEAINKVSVLEASDISRIWNDPLLRHSNVLDGLFHSKVIICEGDADCRFLSAIISAIHDDTSEIAPDILFIHCGGKHRMPMVIKALNKLNVPLKVVCDFDLLNSDHPLKEIFESLEGKWNDIEKDWRLIKTEIEKKRPELSSEDLKKTVQAILDSVDEKIFPNEKAKVIQKALKKTSSWAGAKDIGKSYIPSGSATQAFEKIQLQLQLRGLFIIEVGELEGFARSVGNHGPKWVNKVLEKDLKNDPELEVARQFVLQLIK